METQEIEDYRWYSHIQMGVFDRAMAAVVAM